MKQQNFSLDDPHIRLLTGLSAELGLNRTELLRRMLDKTAGELLQARGVAARFIEKIANDHGRDARLEIEVPSLEGPDIAAVSVNGTPVPGLQGLFGVGGDRPVRIWQLWLSAAPESDYDTGWFGLHPTLFITNVDREAPVQVSTAVSDLRPEYQSFMGVLAGEGL